MNMNLSKNVKSTAVASLTLCAIAVSQVARAEADWFSFTMDNDIFAGNDNGYTNGMFFTWIDTQDNNKAEIGFLARAMEWSLPDGDSSVPEFSLGTIGQTMITPDDIEEDPAILPPDDLPYGGLLFYGDTFIRVHDRYADSIAVTIGVVGEPSFADDTQDFVHGVISADEPCCWDEQLDDEVVFQVSRGRIWRSWIADSGSADLLLGADAALGTISSTAGATVMVRYGAQLHNYASALLSQSRTTNPLAMETGWYVYAGLRAAYLANHIFLDGSKSYDDDDFEEIDYDEGRVGYSLGLAYSWKEWSLTFALNDLNASEDDDAADEFSEFGTFTLAWKAD
jgi:lipid A 3-O-deacylase